MAVETLRPNGAGSETAIDTQYPNSIFHWDKVDESSPDEDTTYVENKSGAVGSFQRDLYALPTGSGNGVISSVKIVTRTKFNAPSNSSLKISLKTYGAVYDYDYGDLGQTVWTNISHEMAVNPNSGVAWTWTEINDLEVGVSLGGSIYDPDWSRCTQVYIEVTYSTGFTPQVFII